MFNWFKPKLSLPDEQRNWIDEKFAWLIDNFGRERLQLPVITPSDEFFPDSYAPTTECAESLFNHVCSYMDVQRSRILLQFYYSESADDVAAAFNPTSQNGYALGAFDKSQDKISIWIEQTRLAETQSLVGTMAHELAHVHLLADGLYDATQEDHEPLTDLLTVYFGFGIFSANSVLREVNWQYGTWSGWSVSKQGYLSIDEYGYALAVYSDLRGETDPDWLRYLRRDLRILVSTELEALRTSGKSESGIDRLNERKARIGKSAPSYVPEIQDAMEEDAQQMPAVQDQSDPVAPDSPPVEVVGEHDSFSQGVFFIQEGKYEEAIEAFTNAVELAEDDAETWYERGRAYFLSQQYSAAVDDYSRALELDSKFYLARSNRALALAWLKRYIEAIDDVKLALKMEKKDPVVHYVCGVSQTGIGKLSQALKSLNLAARYAPGWGEIYIARSRVHQAMNNHSKAEEDLLEAIRRDPSLSEESSRNQLLSTQ